MIYQDYETKGYAAYNCICFLQSEVQFQHMCNQYLSISPSDKVAVNNVSFHQYAVIELLVEENITAADIFNQICHVYQDSCMGGSSV
jgi:hypothetical protein